MRTGRLATLLFCSAIAMTCVLSPPRARSVVLVDSPDVKIVDSTTTTEALGVETSVFVHPTNYRIVLVSLIAHVANPQPENEGCAGWLSQDGGHHWHGDDQ